MRLWIVERTDKLGNVHVAYTRDGLVAIRPWTEAAKGLRIDYTPIPRTTNDRKFGPGIYVWTWQAGRTIFGLRQTRIVSGTEKETAAAIVFLREKGIKCWWAPLSWRKYRGNKKQPW